MDNNINLPEKLNKAFESYLKGEAGCNLFSKENKKRMRDFAERQLYLNKQFMFDTRVIR